MEKKIFIISGESGGKTRFSHVLKQTLNIWTWEINPYNLLAKQMGELGWDGKRDDHYYTAMTELVAFANKHFNFKHNYVVNLVEKFLADERPTVLVIHACDKEDELIQALKEKYGAKTLHIFSKVAPSMDGFDFLVEENESFDVSIGKILE
jgi:hypothetical protein